jgi:signal transduction histidine kinase
MLLDELGMLRVLASLGMVIGEFTHEVDQTLGAADIDAQTLAESLAGSPEQPLAQRLLNNVRRFESYASYFDRTVRENVDRELRPIELGDAILSFVEVVGPSTKRKGTTMSADVLRLDLFTCPAHPSEIDSVLFNFHTNALKAIRRARRDGTILVRAGREADRVFIEFADNGDGIPIEIRDRIFNPFFTTSTPGGGSLDADDDLRGSGLGLKIVRDIATGYGGEVELVTPPDGYSTCFRFELPIATEETLSDAL